MDGWKTFIFEELEKRNIRETKCYQSVFDAYNNLLIRENTLQQRNFSLERDIESLKQNAIITPQKIDTSEASEIVKKLDNRIFKLSQELTDAYRLKSENVDAILRLKDEIHKIEATLIQKEEKLDKVQSDYTQTITEKEEIQKTNLELNNSNELLKEEILLYKKLLENSERTIQRHKDEKKSLLDNILTSKEKSAEQLNEMNAVCNVLRQKLDFEEKTRQSSGSVSVNTGFRKLNDLNIKKEEVKSPDLSRFAGDKNNKERISLTVKIPLVPKKRIISHSGQVTSVIFDKTGSYVLSCGDDKFVRIWDILGNPRTTLQGAQSTVMFSCFSPNGLLILGTTSNGTIIIWEKSTSRIIHTLTGHSNKIYSAIFTPDSSQIVSAGHDRAIKIWSVVSGYCKRSILCFSSSNHISLSCNGNTLASAHMDGHVRIWSIRTGELLKDLNIHTQQVTSVQFSLEGSLILSNSKDGFLKLIETSHFDVIQTFSHKDYFNAKINWNKACISPDSNYVLAGSNSGSLIFWNIQSGKITSKLEGHQSPVTCTDWSSTGRVISCDSSGLLVYWE